MTKPLRIEFVVADGDHARWVRRAETADDFVTVREIKAHAHSGGHAHGDHDHHAAAFARTVADAINAEAQAGREDRLALVAPARMMGALRADLSGPARALVVHEIDKDLTKVGNHDLDAWLRHPDLA